MLLSNSQRLIVCTCRRRLEGKKGCVEMLARAKYVELSREHEYLKSAGFLITAGKERHPL
jgi:hypothetical protein